MQKMKDSGVAWIGEIPEGWEVTKLKMLGTVKGRIGFKGYTVSDLVDENSNGCAIVLGGTNIMKDGSISYGKLTFLSKEKYLESPEIMLYGGEILITKVGAGTGETALYSFHSERVTINPNVMIFLPQKINNKFIKYYFLSSCCKDEICIERSKSGAQPAINQEFIKNLYCAVPSLQIQQRIADFLDAKCAHIDDTIAKEKELIEKLKEYRQSVITEAITKGLNPSAPMKDSGIDWIREIPEHWNITKLGRIYLSRLGKMLQPNKVKSDDTLETYLCAANVTQKGISTTPHKEMWFSEKEKVLYEVKSGDLLIVEGGDVGLSCIYDSNIKSYIQNSIHCISPVKTQSLLFLSFWFKFIKGSGYLDLICNKATIAHYTKEKLLNTPFVFVPIQEQQEITIYINEKTKLIDHAIRQKENLIAQFHQYKKSLIYEAVTGKMEV